MHKINKEVLVGVQPARRPDLSQRPNHLQVERVMSASPAALYRAWTEQFDVWFAAPGSVLMQPAIDIPFFFETDFESVPGEGATRHAHYGRFLELRPEALVVMTWVTGAGGTEGAETVVTVELAAHGGGTNLRLTQEGFPRAELRDQALAAWPLVLEQLDRRIARTPAP
jgi:uncharacterized protein YndB with AHSA1/START domain